jgi:hypothetical protein
MVFRRRKQIKNHLPSFRDKVFRIWLHNEQNASQTAKVAKNRLNADVSTSTITRWRDKFDWEAKAAVYNNELQRMLRTSDDPVLQQLAMDDVETARVLTEIQHIMREVLRHPKKYGMFPKNVNEAVNLLKYSREERERILKKGAVPGTPGATPQMPGITYYDQRKQELKVGFETLPPEQQRLLAGQLSQVNGAASRAMRVARKEAFEDDEESEQQADQLQED